MARLRVAVLALFVAVPASAAGPELLDLVPADALAFFGATGVKPFADKLDKVVADADPAQVGLGPMVELLAGQLGMNASLDRDGPLAVVLASPRAVLGKPLGAAVGPDEVSRLVVGCLPYTDAAKLARDAGVDPQAIRPGQVFAWKGPNFPTPLKAVAQDGRLWLASDEKAIAAVRDGPRLRAALPKDQAEALRRCDALLTCDAAGLGPHWKTGVQAVRALPGLPPLGVLGDLFEEGAPTVAVGVRLEDGVAGHAIARFGENAKAAGVLARLAPAGVTRLAGLPNRDGLVVAHAGSGSGLAALLDGDLAAVLTPLTGERFALYQTRTANVGQFAALAVLECADPAAVLAEVAKRVPAGKPGELNLAGPALGPDGQAIAKLIAALGSDDFDTREAATAALVKAGRAALPQLEQAARSPDAEVARRAKALADEIGAGAAQQRHALLAGRNVLEAAPTLTYFAGVETRDRRTVDVLRVRLDAKDAALEPKLRDLLGPDWDKVRLVRGDRWIAVLVGSETTLLAEGLALLGGADVGLAKQPAIREFHGHADAGRKLEGHVGLVRLLALIDDKADRQFNDAARAGVVSAALSAGPDWLRLDARMPASELRGVVFAAKKK